MMREVRAPALMSVAALLLGLALSWMLFTGVLRAPASHVVTGLEYLAITGVLSLVGGACGIVLIERYVPRLGLKIGAVYVFASAAALVNIVVTPLLMFKERSDFIIVFITLLYFLFITAALAALVAMMTTRRLRAVRSAAARLARGDFDTRVLVEGSDEVAQLAQAFNRVSAELGTSFAQREQLERSRRDLLAAVSHDLRTPLASIRAMVESINDGVVAEPEAIRRYLRLIQAEAEQLGVLIDDLSELSRIESGNLELRLSSVPLEELVAETVEGLRARAEEKGVTLQASADELLPRLALDGTRIQRMVANLIENAIRHTPPGGSVEVQVGQTDGRVELVVVDTGEGIAPEDQPRLFEQFYRGEKSRSRTSGGAGLGLAIARGIAEAHQGTIRVESVPGRGARFIVELAASPTASLPTTPTRYSGPVSSEAGPTA